MNPTEPANTPSPAADPLRTPMADGDSAANSFDSADSAASSRVSQGAAVLFLVMLVGGGSIFAMRQFGLGSGYRYDDITIDYPIDAQHASDQDDYEQVISDLTNHQLPHVPLSDLRPEPFRLKTDKTEAKAFQPVARETEEERLARERAQRAAMIQREFTKLTLNSVIGGSMPIARISGAAVRPGDKVGEYFTVVDITGRSVVLDAEGQKYTLTMSGH